MSDLPDALPIHSSIVILDLSDNDKLNTLDEAAFREFFLYSFSTTVCGSYSATVGGGVLSGCPIGSANRQALSVIADTCPLECCSLSWLFLEGRRYGEGYRAMVDVQCRWGLLSTKRDEEAEVMLLSPVPLWSSECGDFLSCPEAGGEDFVDKCEQTTALVAPHDKSRSEMGTALQLVMLLVPFLPVLIVQ